LTDERAPLQSTDIPANLEVMMEILREEERDAYVAGYWK
jgi:hypothetical protein